MPELIYDYDYFEGQAHADLRAAGHPPLRKPDTEGLCVRDPDGYASRWPGERLVECSPWELGQWLAVLASWGAYASQKIGVADYVRTAAGEMAETRKALIEHTAEGNLTARRAAAKVDPEYVELMKAATKGSKTVRLFRMVCAGYEAKYAAVSRLIALRQGSDQNERTGR